MPFDDLALLNLRGDLGLVDGGIGCSDLAWRRERSVIAHNEDGFAVTSAARGETLDALGVPAADPDPSWFLGVLTSPPPGGVRSDPGPGGRGLTTLCTLVADLTAGKAVLAARDEQPVAIPLADLAEGHPRSSAPSRPRGFSRIVLY